MMVRRTQLTARMLRVFGIAAWFTVPACFTLARPTPPLEEYVLGQSARTVHAVAAGDTGGVTIGLRRLDLAPYLARTAIVVRRGSQTLTSQFRRWGEEPSAGIMRAVAASLSDAPSILAVDVAPWPVRAQHDYLIQLHVSQLEGVVPEDSTVMDGVVRVVASWEIIRSRDGALLARGETDRTETGWTLGDYHGLVTRVDKALSGLAGDLVACLARLPSSTLAPDAAVDGRVVVCGVR